MANIIGKMGTSGQIIGKMSGQPSARLEQKIEEIDSRVDTIITTPAEGVSAQEIIDARGGGLTLGARLDVSDAQLAETMDSIGVSIEKYNGDLILALQNENVVLVPEGEYVLATTINRYLINGKTIKGFGNKSVIKLVGDIQGFNFDTITQETKIENIKIIVEPTNIQDVIHIGCVSGISRFVKIESVWIDTADGSQGVYTGLRFYASVSGVYRNHIKGLQVDHCKNGILLETTGTGWVTHNKIEDAYVFQFTDTAIGIIKNGGVITTNTFKDPHIIDANMIDELDLERVAIKADGQNTFISPQIFNDSTFGTLYCFEFIAGSKCYVLGGYAEGYIKNERYLKDNIFDCTVVKRNNSLTTNPYTTTSYKSTVTNLLKKGVFKHNIKPFTVLNCTAEIISKAGYFTEKIIKLTKTAENAQFNYSGMPLKEMFIGSDLTFTLSVDSTVPCYPIINEGSAGTLKGSYHSGSGKEIISVTKKIIGGSSLQLTFSFDASAPIGSVVYIDWLCLNLGALSPTSPVQSVPYYRCENKGTASLNGAGTSVVVNHGLDVEPDLHDISVTPQSSLGNAKNFWVTNKTATQFTIMVDVAPTTSNPNFGWKIEAQ